MATPELSVPSRGLLRGMTFHMIKVCRSVGPPISRSWRALASMLLMAAIVSGCGHRQISTAVAPRLTPTADTVGVRLTMDRVSGIPIAVTSSPPPRRVTFRSCRHVSFTLLPTVFVVDGKVIGRRSDGFVDHVAAGHWLGSINPNWIASIEVLKGDEAVRRFGSYARGGALLFELVPDTSRAPGRMP